MSKLGVIDSGLGGALVVSYLHQVCPKQDLYYFADQTNAPYGDKTKEEIIECSIALVKEVQKHNINQILIACNTICANAYDELVENFPMITFVSIIQPTIAQITSKDQRVLVLATQATVDSHAYQTLGNEWLEEVFIDEVAAKALVPLIEGQAPKDEILSALENIFSYIDVSSYDKMILGCTHYPLIKEEISSFFKKDIVDSHKVILQSIKQSEGTGSVKFYTSGSVQHFKKQVKMFLKEEYHIESF